jgi:hypothetical protein
MTQKHYKMLFADLISAIDANLPQNASLLYFEIGNIILANENHPDCSRESLYGLFRSFQTKGVPIPNPAEMRRVAAAYREVNYCIRQFALTWLTWEYHINLVRRIKNPAERQFYINAAVQEGWSCQKMLQEITNDLYSRTNWGKR